ncbi:MAG: hypothetical protein NW220_03435 [Leptolyngbyaceae cyanobacterium bins.349]|nr:hypothetical protein [Leptolyngbyaceae cyanobacterium bins.349]
MDYAPDQQGSWRCVAGSTQRSYEIEQLDRQIGQLQLAIYQSPQIDAQRLIEVVQIRVTENSDRGLLGHGRTQAGQIISIQAFQRTVDFVVNDPAAEPATGVCSYLSDQE